MENKIKVTTGISNENVPGNSQERLPGTFVVEIIWRLLKLLAGFN